MDETSAEKVVHAATGNGELKQQDVITVGIFHDFNPHLKLALEYNRAKVE